MTMQEPMKKRSVFKSYKPPYKTPTFVKPKFQKFPENRYFKNLNQEKGVFSQPTSKFQKNEIKSNYYKPDRSSILSNFDKTSQSTAESYVYDRPKYNPDSTCRQTKPLFGKIAVVQPVDALPKPDFSKYSPSIRKRHNDVVHPKFTSHPPLYPKHKPPTTFST